MLVKIFGGAVYGINALTITIEVNILWGAKFIIVGLPDNAVKESQQRIDSALREIGLKIPGKRVIINMAPADVKKEGSSFDLPLAIGTVSYTHLDPFLERHIFIQFSLARRTMYAYFENNGCIFFSLGAYG